ncbi:MAG: serine protease, partial [Lentisphaerota bacterium]
SGCIIKGKKILTNAHVVSDETFIQVRRYGDSKKFQARVIDVSHAADLALLSVDDPAFFDGVEPLDVGELPKSQEEVLVYGFPMGGDTLSITKGVVSRIEHQTYAHSSASFLAVQIDAAINPGNSGGPAIIDNKIVGVTMQGMTQADNIGYIVPAPIITHFLLDLEDGRYDGYPSLGVVMQNMESPTLKKKYRMPEDKTGMLIVYVVPGSPADGFLKQGDVIMSVEEHPIADDGTIEFRPRERTSVSYLIQQHQVGDPMNLTMLRDGEEKAMTVKLSRSLERDRLIPLEQYDVLPTYYIYGGVVFCPLSLDLLKAWGPEWYDQAPEDLVSMLGFNYAKADQDEVVLALKVLAADANQGYHDIANWVVAEVNGKKIKNLKDLISILEGSQDEFVVLKNRWGNQIILDRKQAEKDEADILNIYRIRDDRSGNLQDKTEGIQKDAE